MFKIKREDLEWIFTFLQDFENDLKKENYSKEYLEKLIQITNKIFELLF